MTNEELGILFPIELQAYSDDWAKLYSYERKRILKVFHNYDIIAIDHIGSTAIDRIKAKPIIDILLQVSKELKTNTIIKHFKDIGYECIHKPENPPPHLLMVKGYTPEGYKGQAFHVHVRHKGSWDEIKFRDYLIKHPDVAKEYENLKIQLAKKHKYNRELYTHAKTEFIHKITLNHKL